MPNRRAFLSLAASTVAGLSSPRSFAAEPVPVTGKRISALEPFDSLITSFVETHRVPGAALAVSRGGKLVYARGFGYADRDKKEAVEPDSLFRIASVSKPVTAVAVMQLAERGEFKLDDKVVDLLKLTALEDKKAKPDPRWGKITVRHCLRHSGGWDRDQSYDPIGIARKIARAFDAQTPVPPESIVRYMMGQPLDFDPGERHAYSNLGYLVLGRIIEAVSGKKYEQFVRDEVLAPLKIDSMRLGKARREGRAKGEVLYYDSKDRKGRSLYPPRGESVPIQYGGENFESFEAHGGWIASAIDLVRFATCFDDPKRCPLLKASSIEEMWPRPERGAGSWSYGCGWFVRPEGKEGQFNVWHTGLIAGTEAILVRRFDGTNWAVLFNTAFNREGKSLTGLIDAKLHEAADRLKEWPDVDLFR
jgi:CubicO group peptidase (beta-lactamase class C family)